MKQYIDQIKHIIKSCPRTTAFDILFAIFIIFLDVRADGKDGHYMTLILIVSVAALTTFYLKRRDKVKTHVWNTRFGEVVLDPWDKDDSSRYFVESVLGMLMCIPLILLGYPVVQFIAVVVFGYCWTLTKAMYSLSLEVNPKG